MSGRGRELTWAGRTISAIAGLAGQTPFYAYDRALMTRRVAELRAALPPEIKLHYSLKANPKPAVVHHLAPMVDGFDVASAGELLTALDAGMACEHVGFAGPGKTTSELRQAVMAGVAIKVESSGEVDRLAQVCEETGRPARVIVRVNPDFELKGSGMKMGGGPRPFGVDSEAVPELLAHLERLGLEFVGFHFFCGSQNLKASAIVEAQRRSFEAARQLSSSARRPCRVLNLGGGFGIPYFHKEQPLDLAAVGKGLESIVADARAQLPGVELVIELGRYLVGEAGIYVCRVVDRKRSRGQTFLVVDGGLHHHLAATGGLGRVIQKNYPIAIARDAVDGTTECVSVVGPLCTPLDVLADSVELPHAEVGDYVVLFQSGAYGATASPHSFLSHPRALELLL